MTGVLRSPKLTQGPQKGGITGIALCFLDHCSMKKLYWLMFCLRFRSRRFLRAPDQLWWIIFKILAKWSSTNPSSQGSPAGHGSKTWIPNQKKVHHKALEALNSVIWMFTTNGCAWVSCPTKGRSKDVKEPKEHTASMLVDLVVSKIDRFSKWLYKWLHWNHFKPCNFW